MKRFAILVLPAALLAGCTVICIEGSGNRVSDTGNHSGTLTVPDARTTHGSETHNMR